MKKRLLILMMAFAGIIETATVASAQIKPISSPVEKAYEHSSFVYHNSSMRIQNTGWGGIYSVEFDATLPEAESGVKYGQDFNWSGKTESGSTTNGISHSSTIIAEARDDAYVWKWTSGSDSVYLEAGIEYHFRIVVDLFNKNHSWEITKDGAVAGSASEQSFKDVPGTEIVGLIVCHDLRFGNNWKVTVDETTGHWGETKPQNVKITKSEVFAGQSPEITVQNGEITAKASVYHNIASATVSPVLLLCAYDSNGMMVDIFAKSVQLGDRTGTNPVEAEIKTTLKTTLNDGMKLRAMLIESFANRFTVIDSAEQIYSVE